MTREALRSVDVTTTIETLNRWAPSNCKFIKQLKK